MNTSTCYRHLKTGRLYCLLTIADDQTNTRAGTRVAVYCRAEELGEPDVMTFVRDYEEFRAKFEPWYGRALLEGDEG